MHNTAGKGWEGIITFLTNIEMNVTNNSLHCLRNDKSIFKYMIKLTTLFIKCVLESVGIMIDANLLGGIMCPSVTAESIFIVIYGKYRITKHILTTRAVRVTFVGEFILL